MFNPQSHRFLITFALKSLPIVYCVLTFREWKRESETYRDREKIHLTTFASYLIISFVLAIQTRQQFMLYFDGILKIALFCEKLFAIIRRHSLVASILAYYTYHPSSNPRSDIKTKIWKYSSTSLQQISGKKSNNK